MRFARNAALLVTAALLSGQTDLPVTRSVADQTLASDELPQALLTFDHAFRYLASQRFKLYNVADAEQHFFLDADSAGNVRRFYWLQFEHYLPGIDDHYNYTSPHVIDIGGFPFICDTRIYTDYGGIKPSADSDSAKARSLLAAKGFRLPVTAIRARMIHLPTDDRRSELMIIYVEAMGESRLPPGATNEMPADERFPELAAQVIGHARAGLSIRGRANFSPARR